MRIMTPHCMTLLNNRYRIKKEIGRGGMSVVYLASDERLEGKEWAVKEMGRYGLEEEDERLISQFRQEAEILAALSHPSLPGIVDYFTENGKSYLVMEYIEGKLLENYISETPGFMEEEEIRGMGTDLCEVLEYLHSQSPPVIFRDLKPSNIIITSDGKIKVIDFGIARIFAPGKEKDTIVIGTPGFAAPEQYGTGQTDERSDLYSLGATLYNMATKIDPSSSPLSFSIPSSVNPRLSPLLDTVILKALNLDPDRRFESASAMKDSLQGKATMLLPVCTAPSVSSLALQMDRTKVTFDISSKRELAIETVTLKNKGNRPLKATLSTNRPWLRVDPEHFEGNEFPITVTVDPSHAPRGRNHRGKITITTQEQSIPLPVYVNVAPTIWEKRIPNLLVSILMLLQAFLPLVGLLPLIITFFMCDAEERYKQKIPFVISLLIAVGMLVRFIGV